MLKKDLTVLFQGDSITEWGRNYNEEGNMGTGYAMISSSILGALHPEVDFKFINKGIGGNRSIDLVERWQEDCIDLKPDVVSIMIGINDTWRKYGDNEETSVEKYERNVRYLISSIKEKLEAEVILCEPFVLPFTEEQRDLWKEDLDPKINAVRKLAREFNTGYIPFDSIFATACIKKAPIYWSKDGVHPTQAGHGLMAVHWLEAFYLKIINGQ
ncbi:MAG: SGNH/GDSL hydrolase family protein [Epulopiscium sp.]|nr:SGNH/GDSL hydrolase family protein [Candidatus Epulonipiscium sp.]